MGFMLVCQIKLGIIVNFVYCCIERSRFGLHFAIVNATKIEYACGYGNRLGSGLDNLFSFEDDASWDEIVRYRSDSFVVLKNTFCLYGIRSNNFLYWCQF